MIEHEIELILIGCFWKISGLLLLQSQSLLVQHLCMRNPSVGPFILISMSLLKKNLSCIYRVYQFCQNLLRMFTCFRYSSHCQECLSLLVCPIPCPSCVSTLFCSVQVSIVISLLLEIVKTIFYFMLLYCFTSPTNY